MTRLTRLLAAGLLALVGVTWKVWTPQEVFPQVPLIRAACDWPGWLDWVSLVILLASAVTMGVFAQSGWTRRIASAGLVISFAAFFTLDQHRLQPWAWQFFLLAIVLSLADDATARRCWIWLVISIYFWSAVSKLDDTFCHVQGPALLAGLRKAIGLRGMPNRWTEFLDVCGSLGIALGELTVSLLLMWPRARWVGLWASIAMHVMLLTALGPLGLRHSYGVLTWNVFFIIQNLLLFWQTEPTSPIAAGQRGFDWLRTSIAATLGTRNRIAAITMLAAVSWPALEPFGLCDHWLAWAVYSARPGAVDIVTNEAMDIQSLPIRAEPFRARAPWSARLNVGQWSLDQLGVPIYPEHRFQIGIVWSLHERYAFEGMVLLWNPPNRINGSSTQANKILVGSSQVEELEKVTESFRWNARPRHTP